MHTGLLHNLLKICCARPRAHFRNVQLQSDSYEKLWFIAEAMGLLSRGFLFSFLNIPFVRRRFHNFLSNKERQLWLSRRIRSGRIVQSRGLSNYSTFTGDREFVFISHARNVLPRVGDSEASQPPWPCKTHCGI